MPLTGVRPCVPSRRSTWTLFESSGCGSCIRRRCRNFSIWLSYHGPANACVTVFSLHPVDHRAAATVRSQAGQSDRRRIAQGHAASGSTKRSRRARRPPCRFAGTRFGYRQTFLQSNNSQPTLARGTPDSSTPAGCYCAKQVARDRTLWTRTSYPFLRKNWVLEKCASRYTLCHGRSSGPGCTFNGRMQKRAMYLTLSVCAGQ